MSPCRPALCRTVFVCLSVCLSHVSRLFAIPKFRTPVSVWRARKPTLLAVAPPGFCNGGVRYGTIGGLEYEVPQSLLCVLSSSGLTTEGGSCRFFRMDPDWSRAVTCSTGVLCRPVCRRGVFSRPSLSTRPSDTSCTA